MENVAGKRGGKCLAHRVGAGDFQPQIEVVKCVGLCARGVFGFRDLVEQARSLVHSVFANVNILLLGSQGSSTTKGDRVGDPALGPDRVKGQDLVDGNSENFVVKETSGGLVEGFVGTEVMEAEGKLVPCLVDPEAFHSEDVHVVGVDKSGVDGLVGGVLA